MVYLRYCVIYDRLFRLLMSNMQDNKFDRSLPILFSTIITSRKRSCGKVMFLHLSVILLTGLVSVQGGGSLSRAGGTRPTGMHSCFKCKCAELNAQYLYCINFFVRRNFGAIEQDYMLMAVAVICASAYIVNRRGTNKVCSSS